MKKLFLIAMASLFTAFAFAQEKVVYDQYAEPRDVSSFHAIRISHGIELLIKQGTEEALAISAEEKQYRDAVKTEVVNGELRIYIKQDLEKWWRQLRQKGKKVKAYVSFKNLDHIDGSSGAKTTIDGDLNANSLSIDLSSGASLKGAVKASKLSVDQSSGAASNISGSVQSFDLNISSGAHFYGYGLTAEKCNADASSGAKAEISVSKEMVASASSGGGINYKGESTNNNVSTSSGGKIRKTS